MGAGEPGTEPDILAAEIFCNLEAPLEQFRAVLEDLEAEAQEIRS